MAGQHATLITEVPARRGQIITWSGAPRSQYLPLVVVERDMVVDSVTVRYGIAEGSALQMQLARAADGVDPSGSTTTITAAANCNSTEHTKNTLTLTTSKGVPSENIVPAGQLLLCLFDSDPATLDDFVITVRLSDRLN